VDLKLHNQFLNPETNQDEWSERSLRAITSEIGDGIHATPVYSSMGTYHFINGNNLRDGRIVVTEDTKTVSESEFRAHHKNLNNSSILMSINGTIGNLALFSGERLVLGKSAAYMNVNPDVDRQFVYYALQSDRTKKQFSGGLTGSTIGNLGLGTIRETTIAIPQTKATQAAIAGALRDADDLIESLEQLLSKKRLIKQGAMQELLTGKSRLPNFDEPWQDLSVENVITRYFCGPSPTCEERNITGEFEWGVLKTTAATWKGWDWTKHKVLPRSYWGLSDRQVEIGDVIVTKAGPRHRVGVTAWVDYVPERILVSGKMIGLRPDPEKAVPLMLAAAISATDAQLFLDHRTTGMAESQVNFENETLLKTPIRLPKIEEQVAIALIVKEMDDDVAALEARFAKTQSLKQGMMQELLTGRIRLS
jgi:type I restriction enzyme S subunit